MASQIATTAIFSMITLKVLNFWEIFLSGTESANVFMSNECTNFLNTIPAGEHRFYDLSRINSNYVSSRDLTNLIFSSKFLASIYSFSISNLMTTTSFQFEGSVGFKKLGIYKKIVGIWDYDF